MCFHGVVSCQFISTLVSHVSLHIIKLNHSLYIFDFGTSIFRSPSFYTTMGTLPQRPISRNRTYLMIGLDVNFYFYFHNLKQTKVHRPRSLSHPGALRNSRERGSWVSGTCSWDWIEVLSWRSWLWGLLAAMRRDWV